MSLKKRLDKIESRTMVKEKPTLQSFIHHYNGTVTGFKDKELFFESMEEFEAYAEKEGLNDQSMPFLMVNIVNCQKDNEHRES